LNTTKNKVVESFDYKFDEYSNKYLVDFLIDPRIIEDKFVELSSFSIVQTSHPIPTPHKCPRKNFVWEIYK